MIASMVEIGSYLPIGCPTDLNSIKILSEVFNSTRIPIIPNNDFKFVEAVG
jgi:hypothetical protein